MRQKSAQLLLMRAGRSQKRLKTAHLLVRVAPFLAPLLVSFVGQNKSWNEYSGTLSSWGKTGLSAVGKVTSDGINVINQALVSYPHVECCILNFQQFYFHSQLLRIQLFEKSLVKCILSCQSIVIIYDSWRTKNQNLNQNGAVKGDAQSNDFWDNFGQKRSGSTNSFPVSGNLFWNFIESSELVVIVFFSVQRPLNRPVVRM